MSDNGNKIINPQDPNPIYLNKIPVKEGRQIDMNVELQQYGLNVRVRIAYFGHLWEEDVGDIRVGFRVEAIEPPKTKEGIIIL